MQIKITDATNRTAWDHYVQNHPEGLAYHLFAWKLSVEKAYGFKGLYLAAFEGQTILGVLPLIVFKGLGGAASLISLPYCDAAGPLADSPEVAAQLIEMARELAADKNCVCQIRRSMPDSGDAPDVAGKVRMVLPLPQSSEQLLAGFKSKLRSQIKKPFRDGLYARLGSSELFDDFYRIFAENMRDLGSPVHSRAWIRSIIQNYGDNVRVAVVYTSDKIPAAAGIVLLHNRTVSIPWASSLKNFNRLNPNMMLYWTLLEFASDSGYRSFDFGRSTPGEGTFRFKQQWGAQPQPLSWVDYRPDGEVAPMALSSQESLIRRAVVTIWSKLPTGMTTVFGPHLRKHLSL